MPNSQEISAEWFAAFQRFVIENEQLHPLLQLLPLSPEDIKDQQKRETALENAINRIQCTLNQRARDFVTMAVQAFVTQKLQIPTQPAINPDQVATMADKGYTFVGQTDAGLQRTISDYLKNMQLYQGGTSRDLLPVSYDEASKQNMARYDINDLIWCPEILYTATQPDFLSLAEAYIKHPVMLGNVLSWWSFGGHPTAIHAQNFHLDLDDFRFCKAFVYLTDVDENSGPHCYIPESHKLSEIKSCMDRSGMDQMDFLRWYADQLRKTDEECKTLLGRDPDNITGDAGTRLMVDTSGVHKGLLPVDKDRLLLQFEYCQTATPLTDINLIPFSKFIAQKPELKEHFLQPYVRYACQLILDYSA